MSYATEVLIAALEAARVRQGASQRDVAARTGVPQSHLSKVENGLVDPRASTLVEIGRALGLELRWVPRKALPAVDAVVRSVTGENDEGESPGPQPAYRLDADDA